MKKLMLSLAIGSMIVFLSACSGDGKPLTASSAKSAIKKEASFAKDSQVKSFKTGFQEVSEDYLNSLAQLKKAGMISYTTESVVETVYQRKGSYWSGYYTETREITHYFANVSLTPEGQKFVIEEPTELRADIKKDFEPNKDYEEKIPDYMSAIDDLAAGTSKKTSGAAVPEYDDVVDTLEIEEDIYTATTTTATNKATDKENPNAAYEAMLARVETNSVYVLIGRFEIVKVKEVLCTEDMFKEGRGTCTLLYKFVDKTPFGFVLGAPQENYILSERLSLVHYQDMGWTVAKQ